MAWERVDDRFKETLQILWENIIPIAGVAVAIGGLALVAPHATVAALAILDAIGTGIAGYTAFQSFRNFLNLLNHAKTEDDLRQAADEWVTGSETLALAGLGAIGFVKVLPNLRTLLTTVLQGLRGFPEQLVAALPLLRPFFSSLGDVLKPVLKGISSPVRAGLVLAKLVCNFDVFGLLLSLTPKGALKAIFTMDKGLEAVDAIGGLVSKLKGQNGFQGLKEFLETADKASLLSLINIVNQLDQAENANVVGLIAQDARLVEDVLSIGEGAIDDLRVILSKFSPIDTAAFNQIIQLRNVSGMSIAELKSLLNINGMFPALLSKLLDVPGISITKLRELLKIKGMTPTELEARLDRLGNNIQELERLSKLRTLSRRHYLNNVDQKTVAKDLNTVVEPGVDIAADVAEIRAGLAQRDGDTFLINGRIYGQHNGTLYPISGAGFHQLDRAAFKALGVYNKFGNTPRSEQILNNMGISDEARESALNVWRLAQ